MELDDFTLVAEGLGFAEGPVALDDGTVLVVDLIGGSLWHVDRDGTVSEAARLGGGPNGAAMGPDGLIYICNNGGPGFADERQSCIQRVDLATGQVEVLYADCRGRRFRALNDLVFDAAGGFWFTDFGAPIRRGYALGAVYYASTDGSFIEEVVFPLDHPNGIGLSPDGTVLYWAETYTRSVLQRRVVAPGQLAPSPGLDTMAALRRGESIDANVLLAGLPGLRMLDSLAVDSEGYVCVGTITDPGLTVISPDGQSVEHVRFPEPFVDPFTTNICFGGPDLRTAYVTLAGTGRLVSFRWPRPGLRLPPG
jgi:gluconolactonase